MTSPASQTQGLEVRRIAVALLRYCRERKVTVEEALAANEAVSRLEARDRAFLSTLLLTVFRHSGEIDAILAKFLDRPLPRKSGAAREVLEIGVVQLQFLAMPPHAVIDLAVRTAKDDRNATHFSGLINAVLRKISAARPALREGLDAPRLNTPSWLWERWSKNYGAEAARKIAEAHAARPGLDIAFKEEATPWLQALGGERLPNGQVRLPAGHAPVPELPGFADGAWWIQDAAATLPVELLGDVRGLSVLDLCAAPGGKTLQLAARGAEVTAVDSSEARLQRLARNLARTSLTAEIRAQDVLSDALSGEWDGVLLDAPCSATGTIRRHPELPFLKGPEQILELAGLQRRLLRKAGQLVKPGGILVYCSCSLEPEEGESQARSFLRQNEAFEIVRAEGVALPDGALQPEGWVRTLPFMNYGKGEGLDGFFAIAMRRRP